MTKPLRPLRLPRLDLGVAPLVLGAGLCALPFVPAPLALGLGVAVALVFGTTRGARLREFAPRLLSGAVVGLGAGVGLGEVAAAGVQGVLLTLVTATACIGLGLLLARLLRVDRNVALLVAVGTAICGGTAIAAVSPVLGVKKEQTAVALGTVFVLNAVAMLALPMVGRALGLDAEHFGTLAALAVHDTSAVIGAAASFGDHAVEVATTVKLARVVLLLPVSFVLTALPGIGSSGAALVDGAAGEVAGRRRRLPKLPWFVLGFLAASAVITFVPGLEPAGEIVAAVARRAMVVALFLVGAGLSRQVLQEAGFRPLLLGFVLWLAIATLAVGLVVAT